jgi:predicted nucleotidyltransferase
MIILVMSLLWMASMTAVSIGDALFTKTQQKVLGLLFGKPDKRFYTNEIMRQVAMGRGTVSRELGRLLAAGLLTASREGNQSYYQANRACPVFEELVAIVKKTFGVADEIRLALNVLDKNIESAFIYGSIAKGTATASSDIDLMLVADGLSYGDVIEVLMPVEATLQRAINPTIYGRDEFNAKLSADNSFITRVMEQPKIMIKGGEDDIGKAG